MYNNSAEQRQTSEAASSDPSQDQGNLPTVSFHNFKSRNFKLSVSNPKSKHVACLSVLSQISNCQGLGSKNDSEILKTDRSILLLLLLFLLLLLVLGS